MEETKNDDVIRLGDIFHVLWKNIILIAIITAAVFVCGDEREVQTLCGDLETLMGTAPVRLLSREWQLRPGAVGTSMWINKCLCELSCNSIIDFTSECILTEEARWQVLSWLS